MRLVAEGLSATRGEDLIFRDISFEIAGGGALVVKGPNGSGKSTLLRVLAGLLPARSGSVKLLAAPPHSELAGLSTRRRTAHTNANDLQQEFSRRLRGSQCTGFNVDVVDRQNQS